MKETRIKETHQYVSFYIPKTVYADLQQLSIQNGFATVNGYMKAAIELMIEKEKEKTAQRTVR